MYYARNSSSNRIPSNEMSLKKGNWFKKILWGDCNSVVKERMFSLKVSKHEVISKISKIIELSMLVLCRMLRMMSLRKGEITQIISSKRNLINEDHLCESFCAIKCFNHALSKVLV